ncbi:hypothetical protein A2U01_0097897, partial [Trifolium medium]|nr:hypothetical protein [Trifolium medium]
MNKSFELSWNRVTETTAVNVKNGAWLIGGVSFDSFILGSRDMKVLEARNEGGSQIAGFHGKVI